MDEYCSNQGGGAPAESGSEGKTKQEGKANYSAGERPERARNHHRGRRPVSEEGRRWEAVVLWCASLSDKCARWDT
ncbi:hypothetical protein IscW_ISCW019674 [Ixodes scapularis]|uniref:Uncharacterized protein n=1 Tax=Ixodes scapularis TaxID=6945 RepID=B7PW82_IXOSC|nr:hypothetical protein IscW_ISCW019674 [Ixodes scapularis]|eukprot:XP_002409400.1 hypothetical protein IscW_ISCW019674 [Ixodes scapularis]